MAQDSDKRRSLRLPIEVDVNVYHPRSRRLITAELYDISPEGCRLVTPEPFEPSAQLLIRIAGMEPWPARVVWVKDGSVGIEFHKPINAAVVEHHARQFPKGSKAEAEAARERRRRRPSVGEA